MDEVLKKQIDRLIKQMGTPVPSAGPERIRASTTRVLAGDYLMGLMALGLHLNAMTPEEMQNMIGRVNAVTTSAIPETPVSEV